MERRIPRTIGELISVSKRAVRDFQRALEEVGELVREQHQQNQHERIPVRVPVRNRNNDHPLTPRKFGSYNRYFSTVSKSIKPSYVLALQPPKRGESTLVSKAQTSFSSVNGRPRIVLGGGLYTGFSKHHARMFSTYGSKLAISNLTSGFKEMLLNNPEKSINILKTEMNKSKSDSYNLALANGTDADAADNGCFIEFNLSAPKVSKLIPNEGLFDLEMYKNLFEIIEKNISTVLRDIETFQNNIGSAIYKLENHNNSDQEILRFYCPNCDVYKMELLLSDNNIKTGIVKPHQLPGRDSSLDILSDIEDTRGFHNLQVQRTNPFDSYSDLGDCEIEFDTVLSSVSESYFERAF